MDNFSKTIGIDVILNYKNGGDGALLSGGSGKSFTGDVNKASTKEKEDSPMDFSSWLGKVLPLSINQIIQTTFLTIPRFVSSLVSLMGFVLPGILSLVLTSGFLKGSGSSVDDMTNSMTTASNTSLSTPSDFKPEVKTETPSFWENIFKTDTPETSSQTVTNNTNKFTESTSYFDENSNPITAGQFFGGSSGGMSLAPGISPSGGSTTPGGSSTPGLGDNTINIKTDTSDLNKLTTDISGFGTTTVSTMQNIGKEISSGVDTEITKMGELIKTGYDPLVTVLKDVISKIQYIRDPENNKYLNGGGGGSNPPTTQSTSYVDMTGTYIDSQGRGFSSLTTPFGTYIRASDGALVDINYYNKYIPQVSTRG